MIRKHFQLYSSVVGTGLLFLILLALAQANTTWAAHGEQGTIGQPTTTFTPTSPSLTGTPHGHRGGCDAPCTPVPGTPASPTPLPKLPVTGSDAGNGLGLIWLPLLVLLGAGVAWQGLRLARR
jgi:hypothetical protein